MSVIGILRHLSRLPNRVAASIASELLTKKTKIVQLLAT